MFFFQFCHFDIFFFLSDFNYAKFDGATYFDICSFAVFVVQCSMSSICNTFYVSCMIKANVEVKWLQLMTHNIEIPEVGKGDGYLES